MSEENCCLDLPEEEFLVDCCCCRLEAQELRRILVPGVGFLIDEDFRTGVALRASSQEHAKIMLKRIVDCAELIGPFLLKEADPETTEGKPSRVSRPRK